MDIFKQLFELGAIWAGLIVSIPFLIIVVSQYFHERGKRWARPVQWATAVLYILALMYFSFVY